MYHQQVGDWDTISKSWHLTQCSTFYLLILFCRLKHMWWKREVIKGQVSVLQQVIMHTRKKKMVLFENQQCQRSRTEAW